MSHWFEVGSKVWFMGFGLITEVLSIDKEHGTWIGFDLDGEHKYPLDEAKHWRSIHINSLEKIIEDKEWKLK